MIEKLIFDIAWNAIEAGNAIRNIILEKGRIEFIISDSRWLRKTQNYLVELSKLPSGINEGYDDGWINVSVMEFSTNRKQLRKLNKSYIIPALRKNPHIEITILYLTDLLPLKKL